MRGWIGAVFGLLAAGAAQGQSVDPPLAQALSTDAAQARDPAVTRRYEAATILGQTTKAFDELVLPSAAAVGESYASDKRFGATVTAQGRVTRTLYVVPPGRSTLEVHANYRDEVAAKGFETLLDCAREACGPSFTVLKYAWDRPATHVIAPGTPNRRSDAIRASFDRVQDVRYTLLKKSENGADTFVAVYTAVNQGGTFGDLSAALQGRVQTLVEVVEPRALERRMETVAAAEMGSKLAAEGRVALYAIQFDFDKAVLKPESDPQLAEMAKLLQATPNLRAYVVGHTDGKGGLDYNLDLSRRRAEAVVQALVRQHKIPASRLIARGLGPLAPLATNRTEEGQGRNRRVEMVEIEGR